MVRPIVLLVGTDKQLNEFIEILGLENSDVLVATARNTEEAAIELEEVKPALVVVDDWPARSAEGVVGWVRGDSAIRDVPVVALVFELNEGRGLVRMGADAFLKKPFDSSALLDVIAFYTQGAGRRKGSRAGPGDSDSRAA